MLTYAFGRLLYSFPSFLAPSAMTRVLMYHENTKDSGMDVNLCLPAMQRKHNIDHMTISNNVFFSWL
jgi:hypothetical protein